ncbi:MAG: hypothetical protein QM811_11370 [Pirellulales bacterium]
MTKKKNDENPIFTATETANFLALDLGGKEDIWAYRLANWRRSSRKAPPPLQHVTAPDGSVGYRGKDMMEFIAAEQAKWLMVQDARAHAGPKTQAAALALLDSEHPQVRIVVQSVGSMRCEGALDVRTARRLAAMLVKAADQVENATTSQGAAA